MHFFPILLLLYYLFTFIDFTRDLKRGKEVLNNKKVSYSNNPRRDIYFPIFHRLTRSLLLFLPRSRSRSRVRPRRSSRCRLYLFVRSTLDHTRTQSTCLKIGAPSPISRRWPTASWSTRSRSPAMPCSTALARSVVLSNSVVRSSRKCSSSCPWLQVSMHEHSILSTITNHQSVHYRFRTITFSQSDRIFVKGLTVFITRSLNKDCLLAASGVSASKPAVLLRGADLDGAALLRLLSCFGTLFKCVLSRFLR